MSLLSTYVLKIALFESVFTKSFLWSAPLSEAFEPFNLIKYDFFYNYNVFKNAREFEFPLPRISKDETTVTLGEIMVKRGLVKL